MTSESTDIVASKPDVEKVAERHLHLLGEGRHKLRRKAIEEFLASLADNDLEDNDSLRLNQRRVLEWMIDDVKGRSLMKARRRLGVISRFVQVLKRSEVIPIDPITDLRSDLRLKGWVHIVPRLQSDDPHSELALLRRDVHPRGPLWDDIQDYLAFHRALGKKYYHEQLDLRSLDEFLWADGIRSPRDVTSSLIEAWYDAQPGIWRTRHTRLRNLCRFFDYLCESGTVTVNPVPSPLLATRRGLPRPPPYIFSIEQISAILGELRRESTDGFTPWHTETCHTMAALQYALGLRHGELRRLRLRDVDLARKTLFIDRTKFYKCRCLPFGPRVAQRLADFLELRHGILAPVREDHPLFVAWWRTPLCASVYRGAFQRALKTLGITTSRGHQPRTHDLRHTFAVHRLLRWYEEGVDVQTRLPWLSTFLGHVDIQSTEVYLTITADLYQQAGARFYECFGRDLESEARHEQDSPAGPDYPDIL